MVSLDILVEALTYGVRFRTGIHPMNMRRTRQRLTPRAVSGKLLFVTTTEEVPLKDDPKATDTETMNRAVKEVAEAIGLRVQRNRCTCGGHSPKTGRRHHHYTVRKIYADPL